ncbi:hypothetical protein [Pseudomonas aeruginosa]|nr:hypothetical protein [Pseudomonas aeruginosa]ERV43302.1 hypothetical protein Q065_03208 [Pseudomonas aeruginosa BL11]ERY40720.1 hypothetical protein Q060_06244 [Pseudomonas aeruginosa BL06]
MLLYLTHTTGILVTELALLEGGGDALYFDRVPGLRVEDWITPIV